MQTIPSKFINANYEDVPYDGDGSDVTWRVSIYGLYIQDGALLTFKNKDEKFWDVPGGGVEMGESLEVTLARESEEEVGWFLQPVRPLWQAMDWFYHDGEQKYYRSLQLFWLAEGNSLESRPTDPRTVDVRFVPLDDLPQLPLYPKILTALEKR